MGVEENLNVRSHLAGNLPAVKSTMSLFPAMGPVGPLGVHTVEMAHATRQVAPRGLDQQMVMIGHQAVGMALPAEALQNLRHHAKESRAVGVRQIDVGKPISPCRYVIERAVEFDPQGPCHGPTIAPANS